MEFKIKTLSVCKKMSSCRSTISGSTLFGSEETATLVKAFGKASDYNIDEKETDTFFRQSALASGFRDLKSKSLRMGNPLLGLKD